MQANRKTMKCVYSNPLEAEFPEVQTEQLKKAEAPKHGSL